MSRAVWLAPAAKRAFNKLRGAERIALQGVLMALGEEPFPRGARKIAGQDLYRIRVRIDGQPWRVLYQIRDAEGIVLITRVVQRTDRTYHRL